MKETLKQDRRHYGIDFLRIVCMLMVAVLHIMNRGSVVNSAEAYSVNFHLIWILEALIFCTVNCYGLISGYVGSVRKTKYSNLAYLWLQAMFYTVGITLAYQIFRPARVTADNWVDALLPVSHNVYWYLTAYFIMYLFTPVLNMAVRKLSAKELGATLVIIGLFLIPVSTITDAFHVDSGMNGFWLCYLYLWGGFFRRINLKRYKWKGLALYFLASAVAYLFRIITLPVLDNWSLVMYSYPSPAIVLAGFGLFLFFVNLELPNWLKAVTRWLVPVSFGVYLVHVQPYIFKMLSMRFKFLGAQHPVIMVGGILGAALVLFLGCALVDFVRLKLFDLLRVRPLLEKLEAFLRRKAAAWVDKLNIR